MIDPLRFCFDDLNCDDTIYHSVSHKEHYRYTRLKFTCRFLSSRLDAGKRSGLLT